MNGKELIKIAEDAMRNSYSPYSGFRVGAALLDKNGKVWTGCNVENAVFPVGICAEKCAFACAVSQGVRDFEAIAVIGEKNGGKPEYTPPCGSCREWMREFCPPDFKIYLSGDGGETIEFTSEELLPQAFDNLKAEDRFAGDPPQGE